MCAPLDLAESWGSAPTHSPLQAYNFNINCLESFNLLVVLRTWLKLLEHKTVRFLTDNTTTFFSLSKMRLRDKLIIDVAKEIAMIRSTHDVIVKNKHTPASHWRTPPTASRDDS